MHETINNFQNSFFFISFLFRFEPPIETIHDLASRKVLWAANHISWIWFLDGSEQADLQEVAENFRLHTEEEMTELGRKDGEMGFAIENMQGREHHNEYLLIFRCTLSSPHWI